LTDPAIFSRRSRKRRGRGVSPGHFSFNVPAGDCETCEGDGTVTVEMQCLPDIETDCKNAKARDSSVMLEVKYKDKNVPEVLQLTVREGARVFFRPCRTCLNR